MPIRKLDFSTAVVNTWRAYSDRARCFNACPSVGWPRPNWAAAGATDSTAYSEASVKASVKRSRWRSHYHAADPPDSQEG